MKKPEKETVSTTVRLPHSTHQWLSKQPDGITDAIKRGIDFIALEETADEPTRSLALMIFELAREVELELGAAWHANGIAHRTFRRMLLRAISKWRPADYNDNMLADVKLAPLHERPLATQPVHDADELGVVLADDVLNWPDRTERDRVRASRKETLQEMLRINQARKEGSNG